MNNVVDDFDFLTSNAYDPQQKYIIDTMATAGFHWTNYRIYFTETLWDLVFVPSDPSGATTESNVRSVFYALWCTMFDCNREIRLFELKVPIVKGRGEEPVTVCLNARFDRAAASPESFTIGAPGEVPSSNSDAPRSTLNLTVRWDMDRQPQRRNRSLSRGDSGCGIVFAD